MRMQVKHFITNRLSRRDLLFQIGGVGLLGVLNPRQVFSSVSETQPPQASPTPSALSQEDDDFLQEMEKRNFQYFWDQAGGQTGLVRDRCNVAKNDNSIVASIAATGFGLTALCIGAKRNFIPTADARDRVLATLRFLWKKMPTHRGFFYHFADINTGERVWDSEVSSVDTSILLCGLLTCRRHFEGHSEISLLAFEIFNRVDWSWLSEDTSLLPHGWTPEFGFLPYRWDYYSEMMMIYLLGLGSLPHPLPAGAWNAWKRTNFEYDGIRYIGSFAPLFVHQFSQAWFDFRGKRDAYADYFTNSVIATKVHKLWCLELAREFPDYSDDLWGITASDSVRGYAIWGGPPAMGRIDGSVVPCAAGGSLPFLPEECLKVLRTIYAKFQDRAWQRYGFVDAFNRLADWYSPDVLGIDQGITMLMAENARTGFVWEHFMKNDIAQNGMARAGFHAIPSDAPAAAKPIVPAGEPIFMGKVRAGE